MVVSRSLKEEIGSSKRSAGEVGWLVVEERAWEKRSKATAAAGASMQREVISRSVLSKTRPDRRGVEWVRVGWVGVRTGGGQRVK